MRADLQAQTLLRDGFAQIRKRFGISDEFPPAVLAAAEAAAARPVVPGPDRVDARDIPFITLDPASSTDLDQAFSLALEGDELVLSYAIADVGFFVDRGGAIETEAWKRGATFYFPDGRVPQYPPVLSEGAASLLPDVDRPAILLTVTVDRDGKSALRNAQRAVVRSRAKLAYESIKLDDFPLIEEFAARIDRAEEARGVSRIEFPEQAVVADDAVPGGFRIEADQRLASEDRNAALSLAANLAVAQCMMANGVGLFRVMADPDEREMNVLRRVGHALGVPWPKGSTLRQVGRNLDPANAKHLAFLRLVRRLGGGASYAVFAPATPPWHSAIAEGYAHATAPLRRLADRYVLDLVVDLCAGRVPSPEERLVFDELVEVMRKADATTGQADRHAMDLVEVVMLKDRVGQTFVADVVDNDRRALQIQLSEPPVRVTIPGETQIETGSTISVKLTEVDLEDRRLRFEIVEPA